jgi:hypothetical protein
VVHSYLHRDDLLLPENEALEKETLERLFMCLAIWSAEPDGCFSLGTLPRQAAKFDFPSLSLSATSMPDQGCKNTIRQFKEVRAE